MSKKPPFVLSMRPLVGIVSGAAVGVTALCVGFALLVVLTSPGEISDWGPLLRVMILSLGALALAYFSVAYLVVRRSARRWRALMVGAMLTGGIVALWMLPGLSAYGEQSDMWVGTIGMAIIFPSSFLLGSATLHQTLGATSRQRSAVTEQSSVFHSDPDILGGTPVFVGTRVSVESLLVYLREGKRIEDFRDDFPSVSQEQAQALLHLAGRALLSEA